MERQRETEGRDSAEMGRERDSEIQRGRQRGKRQDERHRAVDKETGGAALADVEKGPGLTCRVLLHLTAQHSGGTRECVQPVSHATFLGLSFNFHFFLPYTSTSFQVN